jgi:hypothetical protein
MELVHTETNRRIKCVIYTGYMHVQVHTDYLRWLYACTGTYRLSMLVICMYRYIQIIYDGYIHVQVHTDYLRWLYTCTGTYRLSTLVIYMYRYIQIIYDGYIHVQVHTDYLRWLYTCTGTYRLSNILKNEDFVYGQFKNKWLLLL